MSKKLTTTTEKKTRKSQHVGFVFPKPVVNVTTSTTPSSTSPSQVIQRKQTNVNNNVTNGSLQISNHVSNDNNEEHEVDYGHLYGYQCDDDDENDDKSQICGHPHPCDLWYRKENVTYRRLRIVLMEFLQSLWYNLIVGIGFRTLGNSWSFGLLQGFAFTSMVGLFWNDDFGFSNIFITMGLCFTRQLRSKEYWIFFLHLTGQLLGGLLSMAGIVLITNDLPGLQTFGTPTKSSLISETSAGFSEFIGTFFVSLVIFFSVFRWNESFKFHYEDERLKQEKNRKKRYYKIPDFTIVLGLAYTALSIGFYDLTGSSFNFLRWAIPRLCMGHFDQNTHDALYYMVGNFVGVFFATLIVYLSFYYKHVLERRFIKEIHSKGGPSSSL